MLKTHKKQQPDVQYLHQETITAGVAIEATCHRLKRILRSGRPGQFVRRHPLLLTVSMVALSAVVVGRLASKSAMDHPNRRNRLWARSLGVPLKLLISTFFTRLIAQPVATEFFSALDGSEPATNGNSVA